MLLAISFLCIGFLKNRSGEKCNNTKISLAFWCYLFRIKNVFIENNLNLMNNLISIMLVSYSQKHQKCEVAVAKEDNIKCKVFYVYMPPNIRLARFSRNLEWFSLDL